MSSAEIIDAVRDSARTGEVTTYEGLPAGPRVAAGDAVIVVEGRADVTTLLEYGVKNAVAVEGTNVPDAVAALTDERTTTAFLDGDRGGDLILKELEQVGSIDYVAVAPTGKSVEDLSREEALSALRGKVAHELVTKAANPREAVAATDGSTRPAPSSTTYPGRSTPETPTEPVESSTTPETTPSPPEPPATEATDPITEAVVEVESDETTESSESNDEPTDEPAEPTTLAGHVRSVIDGETGRARFLDTEFDTLEEVGSDETFHTLANGASVPAVVVLDGDLTQRILDVAAQRGVEGVVARTTGEFVKQPTDVRIRTADQFRSADDAESG